MAAVMYAGLALSQTDDMYDQVIEFVKAAGERLREKAGVLPDIGVRKRFLTEEDLRIEREFGELIKTFGSDHRLYAEEEHDTFESSDNVWVMDPISGTALFMRGLPHYAIVVSHVQKGDVVFAVVYDPSMHHCYVARKGRGTSINGERVVNTGITDTRFPAVIVSPSEGWNQSELLPRFATALKDFTMYRTPLSLGVRYAYIAAGKFDGMIALTKDSFPDFAGSLIVREAGGIFTNIDGSTDIEPTDRVFVAANPSIHAALLDITRQVLA